MNKRTRWMVIGLGVVFGGLVAFNLFKSFMMKRFFASYEPPAVTVSSVSAKAMAWQPRIPAVGNFLATSGVDVTSQAAGNVVKIHFESGQYLQKDAPLIDIDDSVDEATLKFNLAELALKQLNFQRQTDLSKRGAAPVSNVDEARANLEQAQANVERTQAEIRQKHITAPFSGKLGIRLINLGQYISPGQTAIVSLQSLDPLYLEFYLPEQRLRELRVGQPVEAAIEGYPGILFSGTITALNSRVDATTHNIKIQATFPNCPAKAMTDPLHSPLVRAEKTADTSDIRVQCDTAVNAKNKVDAFSFIPGMFANAEVIMPSGGTVIVLPSTAISYSLYGNSVFVIEKDKNGKKDGNGKDVLRVRRVFVNTGSQQGNYTIIERGIKPGQEVVSSGEMKLQNGTRVVINNSVVLHETPDLDTLSQ